MEFSEPTEEYTTSGFASVVDFFFCFTDFNHSFGDYYSDFTSDKYFIAKEVFCKHFYILI